MPHSVSQILNSLRVLVQALRNGSRSSEQRVGMTGAQLFVLQKLSEAGELTVNELAERTHTHQSTVSVVVSRLVEKGFVARVRSEKDARVQIVSLTHKGERTLEQAPETVQDKLLRSLHRLSAAERTDLSRLLAKVLKGAELENVKPTLFLEEPEKNTRRTAAPSASRGTKD